MFKDEATQKLYEQRAQRFIDTSNLIEPDYVPILSQINVFAIGYAGYTIYEALDNPLIERAAYEKANTDFYFDGIFGFGLNHPFKAYFKIQSPTYMICDNGVTVQHIESSQMNENEYDELINDPVKFIANKVGQRKIKGLDTEYPQSLENLTNLIEEIATFKERGKANKAYVKDEMGFPIISSRSVAHPCDNFFDFIRGFKGTLIDIRRDINKVKAAIDAITPLYAKDVPSKNDPAFPWLRLTSHIPTFLSKSQFEILYWPHMKMCVEKAAEAGSKYLCFMEGSWQQHFDLFKDLPKAALVAALERDDIIECKKKYGDTICFAGGVASSDLKFNSIETCIDKTKKIIDNCAPGGGFFVTTDKALISPNDVNPNTFKELNNFIHKYGKY